jgi:hypothetical protein
MLEDAPAWVPIDRYADHRGILSVASASKLGWTMRRAYWITTVPLGAERGNHAHQALRQFFVAASGSVMLKITTRLGAESSWLLTSAGPGVEVPPGCWRVLSDFSSDCVLIVLADRDYEPDDYSFDPPKSTGANPQEASGEA